MYRIRYVTTIVVLVIAALMVTSAIAAPLPMADGAPQAKPTERPHGKPTQVGPGEDTSKQDARATQRAEREAERELRRSRAHYRGTVSAVDGSSISLDTAEGAFTFAITDKTRINIPSGKGGGAGDINVGSQAVVLAQQEQGDRYTALSIHIVPGKPIHIHHVGTVTGYTPGVSITIEGNDGDLVTFVLTGDCKILPEERAEELAVGRRVTIIARRDPTGGPLTAQGIVIHPEVEATETAETETPTPSDTPSATLEVTETPTPAPAT
ncbi:MAG TPA: hypothetical protein VJJ70_09190 [Anaerolineales bacterium]|nr:hypothetical protein [Anaerolineales bacterium]